MRSNTPARYRFAAWTIESEVPLPELPAGVAAPDWRITASPVSLPQRRASWYEKAVAHDGLPWVWLGQRGAIDVIRFPGLAWCEVDAEAARLSCAWRRHLGHEEPEHLLINHILPLAASASGFLVMHASVVVRPGGGAVAIVGPVGAGKSTLAAYLVTRGWGLLSDDRAIVNERGDVYPIAPYVRISPDAASRLGLPAVAVSGHRKVRIVLDGRRLCWDARQRPLERVVFLQREAAGTRWEPSPRHAVAFDLLTAVVQMGLNRADVMRRVFDRVGAIAGSVPCGRLRMAANWDGLGDAETILGRG